MEWNAKPPSQSEWDNLISIGAKAAETSKKLHSNGWVFDALRRAGSGSSDSPGFASGDTAGSGSDLGYTSSYRSSKSASIGSPSVGEMKTSKLSFGLENCIIKEFSHAKEYSKVERTGSSPKLEASVGSGETMLSLKLGKRTYLEDASGESNAKSFSVIPVPSLAPPKRSKLNGQQTNHSYCQVEGCNLDLSSAKDYHRKHRVCESHSKCPKVTIGGLERRFCQQCSRFHSLSEFDEKKRSCRKRLLYHNSRRRKPLSESMQLSSASPSSSFSDGRQQMNLSWNNVPLFPSKPPANVTRSLGYTVKPVKTENPDGQLNVPSNGLQNISAALYHSSIGIFPSNGTMDVLKQGLSLAPSNLDATQDLHHALSLLSTTGSSCEPKPASLDQILCENASCMPQPAVHPISVSFPAALPDYWQNRRTEFHVAADLALHNSYCNSDFREFQQSSMPYEGEIDFYGSRFN